MMTVSKALRDEHDISAATKVRIKTLAQQMGYVPDSSAQSLRTGNTRLLGVVISSLTNPIFSRVVLAIQERAFELGYDVLLAYTWNNADREEVAIRRLLARRVEGLLISPVYRVGAEAAVYKELAARGTPAILLGHPAPFCSSLSSVECEDVQAGQAITRHLLGLGHKRIAFFGGPPGTPWTAERFEGYRLAHREAGLEVDDKLVFEAGRTIEDGNRAAEQLLAEQPGATAVQAVNDMVAVGCADVLMKKGVKIPEQMSITGFGNTLLSEHFKVPLTTVSQPKHRLGIAAMESMIELLKGRRPDPRRLPAELVIRASSGTAPASSVPGPH